MSKYLAKSYFQNGDGFDVEGFKIFDSKEEMDAYVLEIENYFKNKDFLECWYGTNESIRIEGLENYQAGVSYHLISDEEMNIIINLFPESQKYGYGLFIIDPTVFFEKDIDMDEASILESLNIEHFDGLSS